MFLPVVFALFLLPACGWAQSNAAAWLQPPVTPLRSPNALSGQMLRNDTEFLTPEGILDTLPPQQALAPVVPYEVPLDTIEPAAGPATSPTEPAPQSSQPTELTEEIWR